MDPPANKDGPDGSSLKPVSSLLAKFENMNKAGDTQQSSNSSVRTTSPAPKPDRLRDPSPSGAREPPAIPTRPKDRANIPSLQPQYTGVSVASTGYASSPIRSVPPPISSLGPRPAQPPSLNVQPPHSPPPSCNADGVAVGERPHFLQNESLVKAASPATASKQFKIPSRPITPATSDPQRSPRLAATQPPSPPPPRRSGELQTPQNIEKPKQVPPPVNRAEKPVIPSRSSVQIERSQALDIKTRTPERISPFSSPPSSNGTPDEDDSPPMLPARPPRAQQQREPNTEGLQRSRTFHVGFVPPPLHPSTVARQRRGREEENGSARGQLTPHLTGGNQPPALPARPHSIIETSRTLNGMMMAPPPRPPRPGVNTNLDPNPPGSISQKRIVSTPTQYQPSIPPRTHVRSMTVDRTSNRVPNEFRAPPTPVAAPTIERIPEIIPAPSSRTANPGPIITMAYPDATNTNRSKPYISKGVHEIYTKYDTRILDVCGELVCTTGGFTRVWSLLDGELLMSLSMGEGQKGTAVMFKPGAHVDDEGTKVWIGNNNGELLEADIGTQRITDSLPNAHGRYEIIRIYRHFNEVWTLDDSGALNVWAPDESHTPTLSSGPTQSFRVPRGHTFSMVVGDELWYATGKDIRVFKPTVDGKTQFQVLLRALSQPDTGEVISGTVLASDPDRVYFGHSDGKVSVYSRKDYSCQCIMNISQYKINSLAAAGLYLWAGYNNGKVAVYDVTQSPWIVKKEWVAHENPVIKLIADRSSSYKLDRYQVVSLGADNMVRTWDALLQEDWLEGEMKRKDVEYCEFQNLKVLIMTWNAGASTPHSLRYSDSDANFFRDLLQTSDSPDIIIFGFQELVDLEDKTATAKRFLKPKKKEGSDQERMSHQYRDWRDFLIRSLDDYMQGDLYHLLHTAPLVGLFTCIFVKADLRGRISNLSSNEVKRGLGGLHGNKGAIVVRFMVDDTSLCFINCHLAAGQSGANQRHNDVAAILDANVFPSERDPSVRIDSYVGGGDGTMILDHELCVLNGDLNYRIDTMSRDTVVTAVKQGNLTKLLERDQLLVAKRRNPGFRLRAFDELPITFAPTYKYDVGTDNYDTSEKKRSPAWCDRLLYRGRGRIEQLDYRRHEVRVSDHRPVSGRFRFLVKRIDPKRRAKAWMECQQLWEDLRAKEAHAEKYYYLTQVIGYDDATSERLIKEQASRRQMNRSPSRRQV